MALQTAEISKDGEVMAGSLSHITDDNGNFTMDLIDNLGDAHEALEECFDRIKLLEQQITAVQAAKEGDGDE